MLRALVSIIIGAAVTFGLFAFMAFLVGGGAQRAETSAETPVIEITMDRQDSKAQNKPRVVPKPPPPPEQPQKPDTTPPILLPILILQCHSIWAELKQVVQVLVLN